MKDEVKSLVCTKVSDTEYVGIVLAEHWFEAVFAAKQIPYFVLPQDYVVCRWSDFHDGVNSHIEGKTTISVCRTSEDAHIIYRTYTEHQGKLWEPFVEMPAFLNGWLKQRADEELEIMNSAASNAMAKLIVARTSLGRIEMIKEVYERWEKERSKRLVRANT